MQRVGSSSGYLKPVEGEDPLVSLKGKIVTGQLNSGKKFISRLTEVKDSRVVR